MNLKHVLLGAALACAAVVQAKTPVETYGRLIAKGGTLYDSTGNNKVILRGMSLYWSSEPDGYKFYTRNAVEWLQSDWKIAVLRVPLAVERAPQAPTTSKGYVDEPTVILGRVRTVVNAAIAQGLYVIIDWHCPETNPYTSSAVKVFGDFAAEYKNVPNVLWEVWNEPTVDNGQVVNHANQVIAAIRNAGNKNLVIVGSNGWSSQPDQIGDVTDPQKNVAYSLHFYAGSGAHDAYRSNMTSAINKGRTVFATEWGATTADGNTYSSFNNSQTWLNQLETSGVSSCNWTIGTQQANPSNSADNTVQGSAALYRLVSPSGGWDPATDLTPSGTNMRNFLRSKNAAFTVPPPPKDTLKIPADTLWPAKYLTATGFDTLASTNQSGKMMGKSTIGGNALFSTTSTATGYFEIAYRVNPLNAAGKIVFEIDNAPVCTTTINSGSSWTTVLDTLPIAVLGYHRMNMKFSSALNLAHAKIRKILWTPPVGVQRSTRPSEAKVFLRQARTQLFVPAGESWQHVRMVDTQGRELLSQPLEQDQEHVLDLPSRSSTSWVVLQGDHGVKALAVPSAP